MDHYKVSAMGLDKKGKEIEFSITISERSSEVIPTWEKHYMLANAATRRGIALRPPITVELVA